jgi:hypothetical protein
MCRVCSIDDYRVRYKSYTPTGAKLQYTVLPGTWKDCDWEKRKGLHVKLLKENRYSEEWAGKLQQANRGRGEKTETGEGRGVHALSIERLFCPLLAGSVHCANSLLLFTSSPSLSLFHSYGLAYQSVSRNTCAPRSGCCPRLKEP